MLPWLLLSTIGLVNTTTASSTPCKTAWKYFNETKSCYFTGHWETMAEAEDTCRRNDAHLASIHSQEENRWIQALYSEKNHLDLTWIGLRRNRTGSWTWTDGSAVTYTIWKDSPGNKSCVAQDSATLEWLTVRCGVKIHKYICKKFAET